MQVSDFDPFRAVWAARHAPGDRVGALETAWTDCRAGVLMVPEDEILHVDGGQSAGH